MGYDSGHLLEEHALMACMEQALLSRPHLSKALACADREKMLIAYDAMRPKAGMCIDLESFLNYYGPKGRLSSGRRSENKPASLNSLLSIIE